MEPITPMEPLDLILPEDDDVLFPKLSELQEEDPNRGLGNATWDSELTYLYPKKSKLISMFNSYYAEREIGVETGDRFDYIVNRKLMEIQARYDRLYEAYNTYLEQVSPFKQVDTTYDSESRREQTEDTQTIENEVTPDTVYDPTKKNLSSRETTEDKFERINPAESHVETSSIRKDGGLTELNKYADDYRDLDMWFVKEFENAFSRVMYIGEDIRRGTF